MKKKSKRTQKKNNSKDLYPSAEAKDVPIDPGLQAFFSNSVAQQNQPQIAGGVNPSTVRPMTEEELLIQNIQNYQKKLNDIQEYKNKISACHPLTQNIILSSKINPNKQINKDICDWAEDMDKIIKEYLFKAKLDNLTK